VLEDAAAGVTWDQTFASVLLPRKSFTGVRIRVGQVCEQGEVAASHEHSVFATLNRSGSIVDPIKSAPAHLTLMDGRPHGAASRVQRQHPYRLVKSAPLKARK